MDTSVEITRAFTDEETPDWLKENGYVNYVVFATGMDAAIARIGGNHAIFAELNWAGYGNRWCYTSYHEALQALCEWALRDGEGEPQGWFRQPQTGRRRPDGDASKEYICF